MFLRFYVISGLVCISRQSKNSYINTHSRCGQKRPRLHFIVSYKKYRQRLKNTPLMATVETMLAAVCFKTCLDLKDVWDHSWEKWQGEISRCFSFQPSQLIIKTCSLDTDGLLDDMHYLCLAKEKKGIKHGNCWSFCYVEFQNIVCIFNGVCCAIVHLHC